MERGTLLFSKSIKHFGFFQNSSLLLCPQLHSIPLLNFYKAFSLRRYKILIMKSSYNFVLPTLALLIVIQISYVLAGSTSKAILDPVLAAESEARTTGSDKNGRMFESDYQEDPTESQLRQKRHFYRYGGFDPYSGGLYGLGYGGGWGWGGYYRSPYYGSYRRYGWGGGYYY